MSWCQLTPTGHFAVVQAILDRLKELGTHLERLSNLFTRTQPSLISFSLTRLAAICWTLVAVQLNQQVSGVLGSNSSLSASLGPMVIEAVSSTSSN